ncbi:hypothetical protein GCM10022631_29240 [Deinococcus rubellus]|uniref:Superoxide dismutase n=1 Tax=Deinococcus rubellus TaxID=1889240 RepID=A0ABY5YEB6_9DEIO|nr:superoxide dismutase [Deinococcus rubellus]UWX63434.1 superoxide dismutase [Deinococcus rubellus]
MKNVMMFGMGVLLLSSCSMMGGGMKNGTMANGTMSNGAMAVKQGTASYSLSRQPAATDINPMGNVAVTINGNTVMTSAKLTGLAADTYYVAHYHNQGSAQSNDPCSSNGPALLDSMMVGKSDAGGNLSLMGSVAKTVVQAATYYNVHTAKDASGAPADAGVACSAVKIQ